MLDLNYPVTENDSYSYDYIGKDSPELRTMAEKGLEEAKQYSKALLKKYGVEE